MPDDLGDFDAEVEARMATMDGSSLLTDIRRSQCLSGRHAWTMGPGAYDEERRCSHCNRYDVMVTAEGGRQWQTVVRCKFTEPEPAPVAVIETYRTAAPLAVPPPPPWWQRLIRRLMAPIAALVRATYWTE